MKSWFVSELLTDAAQAVARAVKFLDTREQFLPDSRTINPFHYLLQPSCLFWSHEPNLFCVDPNAVCPADVQCPAGLTVSSPSDGPFGKFDAEHRQVFLACIHEERISVGHRKVVGRVLASTGFLSKRNRTFAVKEPAKPTGHEVFGYFSQHALYSSTCNPTKGVENG